CVAGAAKLVGKKVNVQIERVLKSAAYAILVGRAKEEEVPITAESEAEKPTRRAPAKKAETEAEEAVGGEDDVVEEEEEAGRDEAPKPKKKTRRGSRGGRGRKKSATAAPSGNGAAPVAAK